MTRPIAIHSYHSTITMRSRHGFTLIELMITVAIIAILATIALPAYTQSITKTRRRAAEACLSNFATSMERYYTTNLKYGDSVTSAAFTLPTLDCASTSNSGSYYTFAATATTSTFSLTATPTGSQLTRDAGCGTLTLNQTGTRGVSGTAGVSACW